MERWYQKLKGEGWTDLQAERLAPVMDAAFAEGRAQATDDCICLLQRKINIVYVMVGANLAGLFALLLFGAFRAFN